MSLPDKILHFFSRDEPHTITKTEKQTFFFDTLRFGVDGVELTLHPSVFLLVGIQFFDINDTWNSIISSSIFIGFLVSLFTAELFSREKPTRISSYSTFAGGVLLIISGFSKSPVFFSLLILVHNIILAIRPPFFTAIYEANYAPTRRAKLYSAGILFSIVMGLISNYLFGSWLDASLENFRWIFTLSGILLILSSWLLFKIPFHIERKEVPVNPLKNLKLLIQYPIFGLVSFSWMIMGFANLWSLPLRVVYLAEAERGLALNPLMTLVILGVIPNATKLLLNNIWARVFDRFHFVPLRAITSALIGTGLLLFFLTRNIGVIIFAQIMMNIGFACTPFIWNLWVTRVAPPGKSQAFMSVHTFLCGVRGTIGPFVGFLFIQYFSMRSMGIMSFVMVMISIVILLPVMKKTPEPST